MSLHTTFNELRSDWWMLTSYKLKGNAVKYFLAEQNFYKALNELFSQSFFQTTFFEL